MSNMERKDVNFRTNSYSGQKCNRRIFFLDLEMRVAICRIYVGH